MLRLVRIWILACRAISHGQAESLHSDRRETVELGVPDLSLRCCHRQGLAEIEGDMITANIQVAGRRQDKTHRLASTP